MAIKASVFSLCLSNSKSLHSLINEQCEFEKGHPGKMEEKVKFEHTVVIKFFEKHEKNVTEIETELGKVYSDNTPPYMTNCQMGA